jgi:hypothetical protein
MQVRFVLVVLLLCSLAGAAQAAAEIGVVTLAGAGTRVLRGATWYKVVPGSVLEDADIVAADAKAQMQVETRGGIVASLAGPATALLGLGKDGVLSFTMREGWMKLVAKPPGAAVRTASFEAAVAEGIVVMRVVPDATELFVEAGAARVTEPNLAPRDAKRGEFLRKFAGGALVASPGAPKPFVDGLPRNFIDPLPVLAPRLKSRPALVADHDVTYAEAEPWLDGRDRAVFERRFVVRLKDPAFRRAAEANIARYPMWDRILHPEKYQPKPTPQR